MDGDDPVIATPGFYVVPVHEDVGRFLDLRVWTTRSWSADVCEGWVLSATTGPERPLVGCVHRLELGDARRRRPRRGRRRQDRWTATVVSKTFSTTSQGDGALPAGSGDPYWFSFSVPVALIVTYH